MATSSVLRTTDDFDPQKVGDWCDRNSVHDLSNEVRKGDLLEFDCKKPFGWAVCTSRSEDNVQVVFYSSFEKLSDGTLVTVLDSRRVRINNAIVHLQSLSDYNGLENNRLQVISHFLGNRSLNDFIFNRINNCERWADTSVVEVLVVLARVLLSSLELILDFARSHLPHQQTDVGNIGEKTTWYSKDQIDDLMSAVYFGDRLQYDRKGPYRHWGVCIGRLGGELLTLHFSPRGTGLKFATKKVSSSASYAKDSPQFRVDAAGRPIRNRGVRINNKKDTEFQPLEAGAILHEVLSHLLRKILFDKPKFSTFSNNCEHFANECRYSKHHSDQVPAPGDCYRNILKNLKRLVLRDSPETQ